MSANRFKETHEKFTDCAKKKVNEKKKKKKEECVYLHNGAFAKSSFLTLYSSNTAFFNRVKLKIT